LFADKNIVFDPNIHVNVSVSFRDSGASATESIFCWEYNVTISNVDSGTIKLLSRYWKIIDDKGEVQEVVGDGVIGKNPVICKGEKYTYSSGTYLNRPSGVMFGYYIFLDLDTGKKVFAEIPAFSLDYGDVAVCN